MRQEILNQIENYSSFIKRILDEYRSEFIYEDEGRIINLLSDLLKCFIDNQIPGSLYPFVSKLLKSLEVEKLIDIYENNIGLHNWTIYKEACDTVIHSSFFVSRTFYLLKAIGFTNSNVVLIGANGCGKTTFANSIRDELERSNNGIVIPAQKLLIFPSYSSLPAFNTAKNDYETRQRTALDDKQTYTAAKNDDHPYSIAKEYSQELRILVSALIAERLEKRNEYCSKVEEGTIVHRADFSSKIDEVIRIWNNLIEHRTLVCDNSCNLIIQYGEREYPAYRMSDGEREIFYIVGRVLLAKESSLIIVDEPELHLHKAILNKLWDTLENIRKDCMFIYLTHDVEFASSRVANKCWLKSYTRFLGEHWEIEPIHESDIPENLLFKLLGSRKKVLFCEGHNGSLDQKIFEILFPDYTIAPVQSCKEVINFTRAFNKIPNKYIEAYGIIDRDFRTEAQLNALSDDNIFSYEVSEIENLFMIKDFIIGFAKYKREPCNFDEIQAKVIELLNKNKEQQASSYLSQYINYQLKEGEHLKNGKTKDEVKDSLHRLSQIDIDGYYNDRMSYLNSIIDAKDYPQVIRVYNNKGVHSIIEKALGISSYNHKALQYLKDTQGAQELLRSYFPANL